MSGINLPKFLTEPNPDIYLSDNYLVLDFENTIKDGDGSPLNEDNDLVLAVWGKYNTYKSKWGGIYDMRELLEDIEKADFVVAQNAKHELGWLKRCGADLSKILVFDTKIAKYVVDGNRPSRKSLRDLAKFYKLKMEKSDLMGYWMSHGICPSIIPKSWLHEYCVKDVLMTEDIFLQQRKILASMDLLATMYTRCIFTPVLADIEFNGMCLDPDRVEEEYVTQSHEYSKLTTELDIFTGGINSRSTKQVSEFLFDVLKFPKPKKHGKVITTAHGYCPVNEEVLASLKPTNKKQTQFLDMKKELNKLNANLTKNLQFFYGVCKEKGGIFKAQFNQVVTRTHRLSSSGIKINFKMFEDDKSVQFQNMPRKYKRLFCARRAGWYIGESDGAQLEFRVAAYLGRDDVAVNDILSGFDVHTYTASVLTEAGQQTDRQGAKSHTFKPLYGGQSGTEAEQAYYRAFREKYPGIAAAQQSWINEAINTGKHITETGLIFYYPGTSVQSDGYVSNSTNICNYPVQSLATADIIPVAVTFQWHRMQAAKLQSFLVNTIHDSSIAEVHPEEVRQYEDIVVQSFTHDVYRYLEQVYGIRWSVPLGAGIKVGSHWGEAEERKYTIDAPYTLEETR